MSALGHKRTFAVQKVMSGLPPKADIRRQLIDVLRSNADAVAAPPVASPAAPQPLGFGWLADIP
jgi:hypothetical protein